MAQHRFKRRWQQLELQFELDSDWRYGVLDQDSCLSAAGDLLEDLLHRMCAGFSSWPMASLDSFDGTARWHVREREEGAEAGGRRRVGVCRLTS